MSTEPKWPILVKAETTGMNGKPVKMERTIHGASNVIHAMYIALSARKDEGYVFAGCEIIGINPLGRRVVRILNPDTMELDRE